MMETSKFTMYFMHDRMVGYYLPAAGVMKGKAVMGTHFWRQTDRTNASCIHDDITKKGIPSEDIKRVSTHMVEKEFEKDFK